MSGSIFLAGNSRRLRWKSSTSFVADVLWHTLNRNKENIVPITYTKCLDVGSDVCCGLLFLDKFRTPEAETQSLNNLLISCKDFYVANNRLLQEGKEDEARFTKQGGDDLCRLIVMIELRLEEIQEQMKNGTWMPGLEIDKHQILRYNRKCERITLRKGLSWSTDTKTGKRVIEYILNKDTDYPLPMVTTYELIQNEPEIRFHIHKEFESELYSVTYVYKVLKEWHEIGCDILELGNLVSLFERRILELEQEKAIGTWVPYTEYNKLGMDIYEQQDYINVTYLSGME